MTESDYIVIQSSQPPYSSSFAIDALEAAMGATNIGIKVVFIFVGEGVYQLLNNQDNVRISHKSIFKKLKTLPLYDVETVYALSTALVEHNVSLPKAMPNISALNDNEFVNLCQHARQVLVF